MDDTRTRGAPAKRYYLVPVPRWVGKGHHRVLITRSAAVKLTVLAVVGGLVFLGSISLKAGIAIGGATFEFESLDGRGNNKQHPDQGAAGRYAVGHCGRAR